MFGGNFAPQGYALCNGQLLAIAQNTALFSLLGTTYGGDGQTTFALPDLRGRVPIHAGTGIGLTPRNLGSTGGSETNTLTIGQMPAHNHTVNVVTANGNQINPSGNMLANSGLFDTDFSDAASPNATLNSATVNDSGSNQSVNNVQPYTTINYIIALIGIYPSQN
ncbi:MAG: phage tail protein [Kordia sp.]|nr:MAG: phage tail protein [Kordia sp.]